MTLRQAAQRALKAMEDGEDRADMVEFSEALAALRAALAEPDYWQEEARRYAGNADYWRNRYEALAEPEQEPVAWMYHGIRHDGTLHDRPSLIWRPEYMDVMSAEKGAKATPLYTAPTPRKPLTDEEIDKLPWGPHEGNPMTFAEGLHDFARAIERAHSIVEQHEP